MTPDLRPKHCITLLTPSAGRQVHLSFYKNLVYKNIKPRNRSKIKNIVILLVVVSIYLKASEKENDVHIKKKKNVNEVGLIICKNDLMLKLRLRITNKNCTVFK